MTTEPCPLCGRPPEHPMRLEVCGECYQEMTAAGAGALQATGEFHAMTPERVEKMMSAPPERSPPERDTGSRGVTPWASAPRPRSETASPDLACTWCGKQRSAVKKILTGQSGHICNECVALCSDILEAELGPDWR